MKKMNLVELLKDKGFAAAAYENVSKKHVVLTKTFEKDVEVVWHGTMHTTLMVSVFVNLESGICHADFCKDGSIRYKDRWYYTIGKHTFNAIADTVKNAGFEF